MIIDPRLMGVIEWTSQVTLMTDRYGTVMTLQDPDNWREWALSTLALIGLEGADIMNPDLYETWEPWAERFCQVTDTTLGI